MPMIDPLEAAIVFLETELPNNVLVRQENAAVPIDQNLTGKIGVVVVNVAPLNRMMTAPLITVRLTLRCYGLNDTDGSGSSDIASSVEPAGYTTTGLLRGPRTIAGRFYVRSFAPNPPSSPLQEPDTELWVTILTAEFSVNAREVA